MQCRQTVVSLLGQLVKLRPGSEEDLDDYFVRSQELITRLSEAVEAITDTLFIALLINGLPDNFEHFVVQESFNQPWRFQSWERGWGTTLTRGRLDMERGLYMVTKPCKLRGRRKECQVVAAMCAVRRVIWRGNANPKVTLDNSVLEAVGRTKQGFHHQRSKGGQPGLFRKGVQGGEDMVLHLLCYNFNEEKRPHCGYGMHWSCGANFESWNEGTNVEKPNGTLSRVEGKGSVEVEIRDCHDAV